MLLYQDWLGFTSREARDRSMSGFHYLSESIGQKS